MNRRAFLPILPLWRRIFLRIKYPTKKMRWMAYLRAQARFSMHMQEDFERRNKEFWKDPYEQT